MAKLSNCLSGLKKNSVIVANSKHSVDWIDDIAFIADNTRYYISKTSRHRVILASLKLSAWQLKWLCSVRHPGSRIRIQRSRIRIQSSLATQMALASNSAHPWSFHPADCRRCLKMFVLTSWVAWKGERAAVLRGHFKQVFKRWWFTSSSGTPSLCVKNVRRAALYLIFQNIWSSQWRKLFDCCRRKMSTIVNRLIH